MRRSYLTKLAVFSVILVFKKVFQTAENAQISHSSIKLLKNQKNQPPKISLISIRGERHSGTSWLRRIISKNCPNLVTKQPTHNRNSTILDSDEKYGWKHAAFKPDLKIEENDLIIIIFRNYSTWLPRLRLQTYEKLPKSGLIMTDFLREPWKGGVRIDGDVDEKWKNVFEMRSSKYESWFEFILKHPDKAVGVSYEELVDDSEVFVRKIENVFGLECEKLFIPVNGYTKHGREKVFKRFSEEKYEWGEEDAEYASKMVNFDLESRLGYL